MDKKFLIVVFIAITIAILTWLDYQRLISQDVDDASIEHKSEDRILEQSSKTIDKSEVEALSHEALLEENPELEVLKRLQIGANADVNFYGKIVDQYGQPVTGAEIDYSIPHYEANILPAANRSEGRDTTTSDENGVFKVENSKGMYFTVREIRKRGYVIEAENHTFIYTPRTTDQMVHQPDSANPVIFHAWKKGEAARKLIDGDGFWGVKIDNEYHGLPIPETNKSIQIKFVQNPEGKWESVLDWSVHFKIKDGGVMPTDDVFMYEAPEFGYQREWSWYAPKQGDRWPTETQQSFYFQTGNGSMHGRMEVKFIPYYGKKNQGVIDVKYVLNPTGSRNLLPADE